MTRLPWLPPEHFDRFIGDYRALRKRRLSVEEARSRVLALIADYEAAQVDVSGAISFLRRLSPVSERDGQFLVGSALLSKAELVARAKYRGWQPDEWRMAA